MLRLCIATAAIVSAIWFVPLLHDTVLDSGTAVLDQFDRRPIRSVLILGNSRTYYHAMPSMLRRMADSAHAAERYAITTRALAGGSLEDSWNDDATQQLLGQHWKEVVVQAESRAQSTSEGRISFFTFGPKLIAAAKRNGAAATLIVNWVYGEALFGDMPASARTDLYDAIQDDYQRLSSMTEAQLANTGKVWERVHAAYPSIPLYEDGNHPSLEGSYLSALVLYAHLSHTDGSAVAYVPWGMSAHEAAVIKETVADAVVTGAL